MHFTGCHGALHKGHARIIRQRARGAPCNRIRTLIGYCLFKGIFLHLIKQSSDTDTQASITQVDQIEMTGDEQSNAENGGFVQPEQQTDTLQTQAESQLLMSSNTQQNIDEDVIAHGQAELSQASELSPGSLPNPDDVISTQLEAEIKDVVSSVPSVGGEVVPQTPDEVNEDSATVNETAVEQTNDDDVSVGTPEPYHQSRDGTVAFHVMTEVSSVAAAENSTLNTHNGESYTVSINEPQMSTTDVPVTISVVPNDGKQAPSSLI